MHRAIDRSRGELVAVKVQHAGLRDAAAADLAAVALAVRVAGWLFPQEFRLRFVLDELAPHLPLELDFAHEAANLRRCASFFSVGGGGERDGLVDSVALPQVSNIRACDARRLTPTLRPSLLVSLLSSVICPQIVSDLSSTRVLTMSFEE